jgi:two-component system, NarL family, sensor kinase
MASTRVAVTSALFAGVMTFVALWLVTDAGLWGLTAARELPIDVAIGLSYSAAAVLVVSGTGGRRMGWLLLFIGVCGATASLGTAVALTSTGPATLVSAAANVQSWIWVGGFVPLFTLVPLLYPDGRVPGPRWGPWVVASVVGMGLLAVGSATYPGPVPQVVFLLGVGLLVPSCIAGLTAIVVRWRRSDGLVRRQLAVLLVTATILVVDVVLQPLLGWPAGALTQAIAVALVPAGIALAVTRHRLYDLDLAVCRAISGLSLSVCLAAIYVSLFLLSSKALPGGPTVAAATAAAVTGLLLHPLGVRLNRGVDQMFYGHRADPARVLEATASGLREGVDLADVPGRVCQVVVDALRLGSAALVLGADAQTTALAVAGTPAGPVTELPMRHRGEVVGALRVTARPGEPVLTVRDAEILAVVCNQVAPAVAALRLSERLQHSRAALVTAREEERRRLRRDLHDGVGAVLAGVRLQVETAQSLVSDPAAGRLLRSAASGVATAVEDLRSITDDLRPAALDDLGLAAGLHALANRMSTPGTTIAVDVQLDGALPAAAEVACYRIAGEALANAVRHSGAHRVTLRVEATPSWVSLQVEDDGVGLPEKVRADGLGLASMRQRAEEIGGRLGVTSTDTGTLVHAELPTEAR